MSIRVQLADGTPEDERQETRPKIRVTLPPPVEPLPERVARFWFYDEDAARARAPWRFQESDAEQLIRERAERGGAWAG